ncbi:MAG: hypothetical protein A2X57_00820 [Nitrospirae bacterium GWD2_57_8]|nr:MAG: hypothetical protein A2X57_00820 [Nitrospirae bacterium GWD2_57_8]
MVNSFWVNAAALPAVMAVKKTAQSIRDIFFMGITASLQNECVRVRRKIRATISSNSYFDKEKRGTQRAPVGMGSF